MVRLLYVGSRAILLTTTFVAGGGAYFFAKRSYDARLEGRQRMKHVTCNFDSDLNVKTKARTLRGIETPKMHKDEQPAPRRGEGSHALEVTDFKSPTKQGLEA